ncbi:MAG: EAL domain-containing protein [Lachnospiraceae bacterium]|nr:EAL domain-containing protein [Lachnospiraceae bacterium]
MGTDKVTGLYYYDDFKEQSQKLLKRLDFNCLIVTMNVVNFKYINEHYGYETGDELLRKITNDFYQSSDRYAIGCRIHSDRFAFLGRAESVNPDILKAQLEKELKTFARTAAEEMGIVDIRFNMGAYAIANNSESVSESLDKAEAARKKNLQEYTDWVTIYDKDMQDEAAQKREVIYAFQNAIHTKQIKVQLQPVKNVMENRWEEVEVLARLIDNEGNMISPASFMQYLDKTGMISELDCVVLEKSCRLLKKWQDDGKKVFPININIAGVDLKEDAIYNRMRDIVNEYGIDKKLIGLEIKESVFRENGDVVRARINELRSEGYRVCMDDFGSGYTSITELATLSVDMIKFSISFVHNSIASKKGTTMLKGMIGIFQKINIPCICKGVENMLQERLLRECGCKMAQGDVLEPAMDVEKFEKRFIYVD